MTLKMVESSINKQSDIYYLAVQQPLDHSSLLGSSVEAITRVEQINEKF